MNDINKEQYDKYVKAKRKVDEIKGFYWSLGAYFVVIPFLIFIWYTFTPNTFQWFWFPIMGWGIGLIFQALSAFDVIYFSKDWEEKKIKELMEKEEKEMWQ